jgi:hypothetical protein
MKQVTTEVAQIWPKRSKIRSRSHAASARLAELLARMVACVSGRRSPPVSAAWLASQAKGRGFEPRRPLRPQTRMARREQALCRSVGFAA